MKWFNNPYENDKGWSTAELLQFIATNQIIEIFYAKKA